jgi:hypothetical protein
MDQVLHQRLAGVAGGAGHQDGLACCVILLTLSIMKVSIFSYTI